MVKQGNVLDKKMYEGAPIERAHLLRGFSSKKTPIKWIRFFRAAQLQRDIALKKKKNVNRILWALSIIIFIGIYGLYYYYKSNYMYELQFKLKPIRKFIFLIFPLVYLLVRFLNKKFNKKFSKGFEFFSEYLAAFFTLIEEDLHPASRIKLEANLTNTKSEEFKVDEKKYKELPHRVVRLEEKFFEKVIASGTFVMRDESLVYFKFSQKLRERFIMKNAAISNNLKTKFKYKSVYPFTIKMRIPKSIYQLKSEVNSEELKFREEEEFFVFKTTRKFDIKTEKPEDYKFGEIDSIMSYEADFFTLEVINLINKCYSYVTPKQ